MRWILAIFIISCCASAFAQDVPKHEEPRKWWQGGMWRRPKPNPQKTILPLITVQGNKFVNAEGDTILFRGLAISDPDKLEGQGHWNKEHFEQVKKMGATLVRIPVHPIAWRERTPAKYMELLDQAVSWCTELEMYIIIDWHSIGNLMTEMFQAPMYDTTQKETYEFWRTIAIRFRGHNTVAFYEFFNEPTGYRGQLGPVSWSKWKKINEDLIEIVRSFDTEPIPIVSGFDWAYDLNHIRYEPIAADGIAYATHPYSMKRKAPWPDKWEENFGFAADKYPVIATELGFGLRGEDKVDEDHYGYIILNYLENRGISWMCWVYDAEWHPRMIKSWDDYSLTGCGEYFKKALHGKVLKK
ncbi:cellulase family glycosylhydrolase [candidate division KSB1 bacterium]|nr:cellulase family glycosylhydrolase [candidate division KSB1 bacterium]